MNANISDNAVHLDGFQLVRSDRNAELSGKGKGGGLCIKWCRNYTIKSTFCSPLLELMVVNCRPYYLPREISCVRFVLVYIPERPNSEAERQNIVEKIMSTVSECQDDKPESAVIILGDPQMGVI